MHTNIAKWGTSCGLRIPKPLMDSLGLHVGQQVKLEVQDGRLIIEKDVPHYKLEDLVKEMKSSKKPDYMWDDEAWGEEIL